MRKMREGRNEPETALIPMNRLNMGFMVIKMIELTAKAVAGVRNLPLRSSP